MTRRRAIPRGRRFWQPVLGFLIWLFARPRISGEECLPPAGGGIVYYNHIHWLDPVLICGTIHRYAVPLTKIETQRWPVVGSLLRWYHVIFITRGVVDRDALKGTWEVLEDGDISVISPEGTRSADQRLQEAKEGLAFIAARVPGVWLMPSAVTNTPGFERELKRGRRSGITITYGRPFRFRWPEGKVSRETMREMTDEAMAQLSALLPAPMRGAYAEAPAAEPRWLEFIGD